METLNHLSSVGNLIFRTPLLPYQGILGFKSIINESVFEESIFLASPALHSELLRMRQGLKDEKEVSRISESLFRYLLRMSYRCTPFGLFAGISIGSISNYTTINLSKCINYKKNTRLDTHFLSSFVGHMIRDQGVKNSIKWYTNNTIYKINNKLRYIEYRVDNNSRTHHLTHVDYSEYVQSIIDKAQRGATLFELVNVLLASKISVSEAKVFIDEMISGCLLSSELEQLVTGVEYHDQLIEKLKEIPEAKPYLEKLLSVVERIELADNQGLGTPSAFYNQIYSEVKSWQVEFEAGKLLQCDLFKPMEKCQINSVVIDELIKAIGLLNKVTSQSQQTDLQKFKEQFSKRYELREIPFLEVLDSETGIGYPIGQQLNADNAPLLGDLLAKFDYKDQNKIDTTNTIWAKWLLGKFLDSIRKNSFEIELVDEEINQLFKDQEMGEDILPNSVYTICSILASSGDEVDKGNFLVYHEGTSGSSSMNLLGRFCHMNEELINLSIKAISEEEKTNPDCLYAEILHIPQSRLGNILMRPILRKHEIPILTRAAVDEENIILLNSLMVSVRNNKILLRSKKFNKEVIPRLTSAHNFHSNNVPHYHFLCDLQFQGVKGALGWNWGALSEFPYLPRIRYGKTILSKARWTVYMSDITQNKDVNNDELIELIKKFVYQKKMPSKFTISQGDNQLPIDIENIHCMKIFSHDLKKYKTLQLHECLFNESNLLVRGPEGAFTNEIIVPWINTNSKNQSISFNRFLDDKDIQRTFTPGYEWIYIKIYCGLKTADTILVEVIKHLIDQLFDKRVITKFFFIRYTDPEHHIRLRFMVVEKYDPIITEKLNELLIPYLASNQIWKIQTDSYQRELERYGPENMENTELFFSYDSIACVRILSLLEGDKGDEIRWQFAVKGVNDILNLFGLDIYQKKEITFAMNAFILKEFPLDKKEIKKDLSSKYRSNYDKVHLALQPVLESTHEFYPVWQIFSERNKNMNHCIEFITNLELIGKLSVNRTEIISSYIHMFLNRFLRSKQKLQEMVIYDFLHKHYKSVVAIERNEQIRNNSLND